MGRPLDGIALQTFFRSLGFSPERQELLASQATQELFAKIPSSPPSRTSGGRHGNEAVWYPSNNWNLEVVERPPGSRGFSLLPRRWVVERTLS